MSRSKVSSANLRVGVVVITVTPFPQDTPNFLAGSKLCFGLKHLPSQFLFSHAARAEALRDVLADVEDAMLRDVDAAFTQEMRSADRLSANHRETTQLLQHYIRFTRLCEQLIN